MQPPPALSSDRFPALHGAPVRLQHGPLAMRQAVGNASTFGIALTPGGFVMHANEAALALVGARLADVAGRPFDATPWAQHLREGRAAWRYALVAARAGHATPLPLPIKTAESQRITVDFLLQPLAGETGTATLLVLTGRDVPERHRVRPADTAAAPVAQRARALIVDDEAPLADCLARLLQRHLGARLELVTCTDAHEAISHLQQSDFDLVISDCEMPALDGVALLGQARALQPQALRLMLVDAHQLARVLDGERQVDVFRYLAKPWSSRQVLMHVEAALQEIDDRRRGTEAVAAALPGRPPAAVDAPIAA